MAAWITRRTLPARAHWRAVNVLHLVALVRDGAKFENGNSSTTDEPGGDQQAAWPGRP